MEQFHFYVCETCGNFLITTGDATITCCGRQLQALHPQKAEPAMRLQVEEIEDEWYLSSTHPMRKDDYISFVAFLSGGAVQCYRQYPEWDLQLRIPRRGHGMLLWYAKSQGLLSQLI